MGRSRAVLEHRRTSHSQDIKGRPYGSARKESKFFKQGYMEKVTDLTVIYSTNRQGSNKYAVSRKEDLEQETRSRFSHEPKYANSSAASRKRQGETKGQVVEPPGCTANTTERSIRRVEWAGMQEMVE